MEFCLCCLLQTVEFNCLTYKLNCGGCQLTKITAWSKIISMYGSVQVWVRACMHVSVPELSKFRYLVKLFSMINLEYSTIFTLNTPHNKREFVPPEPKETNWAFTIWAGSHLHHSRIPRNRKVSKTDISTLHLLLHETILCKQTLYHKTAFISYYLIMWLIHRIFTDRSIHILKQQKVLEWKYHHKNSKR